MVASKTISVSSDNITYYVLPGNTGDFAFNTRELDDTIFGQPYKSSEEGLADWTVKANAFWKGFAGYTATINITGTPTTMTGEACTFISGKTYQITNAAHQIIDPNTVVHVFDSAVDQTANVLNIDYLFGKITFLPGYTVGGSVTISGDYLPKTALTLCNDLTLGMATNATDISDFATVQGNGAIGVWAPALNAVTAELKGFYNSTTAWRTKISARTLIVLDISPDGGGLSIARGFFRAISASQSGSVGQTEAEAIKLALYVPSTVMSPSLMLTPFNWAHSGSTTLSLAVQKVISAFLAQTNIYVKYLENGTTGKSGQAIVTECSLATSLTSMNTFTCAFQGTGALTTI